MKSYVSAAIVAVGLLALGLCLRSGLVSFTDNSRVVEVRGLCEREMPADKVIWPLQYNLMGNDLPMLYRQIESNNKIVTDFLTGNGISASEYSIGAPNVNDMQSNSYSSNNAPYRYNITMTITVASDKVDQVRALINRQGELLKEGVSLVTGNWDARIVYEFTKLNDIKPEMIAEATKNARAAAEKFAEDSGSKIGKIKNARQGQFSIEDRDNYTPYIKNIRVVTSINYYIEK
ncbi:MAG: SIMPL domain-containing protein [Clostridium sp.]|nr:SIMPL domain-containing protein [Clostridium sp.]